MLTRGAEQGTQFSHQRALATAANSEAITATVEGLSHRGELVVIGAAPEPLGISPFQLLPPGKIVRGHPSGTAQDVQDTMAFSVLHGIRPTIERARCLSHPNSVLAFSNRGVDNCNTPA